MSSLIDNNNIVIGVGTITEHDEHWQVNDSIIPKIAFPDCTIIDSEPTSIGVWSWDGEKFIAIEKEITSDPEPSIFNRNISSQMRQHRNHLIADFEPRLLKALRLERMGLAHESIAELDAYLQALADVPQQSGFPDSINWPTKP